MDDKSIRGAADRSRIHLNQPHEVNYRTTVLDISENDLASAVKRVGRSTDKVKASLKSAPRS
ncbi:MAG: DUF3606 domain-containing protein [Burkholderiaceae bacterium]